MALRIRLEVFGRPMLVERAGSGWQLFYLGTDGKRSRASDVMIPDFVAEDELAQYLADIFHESATPKHPGVRRLAG